MASRMVLVIHGFCLWNDLALVLGTFASVVLQIKSPKNSQRQQWCPGICSGLRCVVQTVGWLLISLTIS